ncbi:MAG: LysM peptidoglycan-binding domain-containing protein [Chelatococcus sp.]|uniref:LysM peptidoglycan-binding domain-containing protein n=1 Tax=Chelatococcus sp. TaxID=1953771 RepID=UPI0025BBC995|nr:LysM peptidoglycan-binding domain-containing protein [Chelatococcus sp.]MBX3539336.1 LysM peptidoglycan-binding domain-containing protein [Chelatococcus sp.]
MARSRGIQVAVAIVAAVILAVLIYAWGVPRRTSEPTAPAPVASVPAAPPSTTAPQGSAAPAGQAAAPSPAGAGAPRQVPAAQAPASQAPAAEGQASTPSQPSTTAPSFDVVRVEPDGSSVVAGRAPPGSRVELLRNGQPISTAIADASGAFAMVPPALEPGTHELSLRCIVDGKTLQSGDTISVVVAGDRKTAPMVALLSPNKPAQILSRPSEQAAQITTSESPRTSAAAAPSSQAGAPAPAQSASSAPVTSASRSGVVVDTVEAEDGRMFVSGRAAPSATVRLYLNDSYVASAVTGPAGHLSFTIERGLAPGEYRVRLDDVEPTNGAVKSRAEVAFTMPVPAVVGAVSAPSGQMAAAPQAAGTSASPPATAGGSVAANAPAGNATSSAVVIPEVNTTTVVRGDNLWRISRRVYGRGARYTVIYDANQNQIRNHHRIYPGQVFVLPRG